MFKKAVIALNHVCSFRWGRVCLGWRARLIVKGRFVVERCAGSGTAGKARRVVRSVTNIKTVFSRYRGFHNKDKTTSRSSYLHSEHSHATEMTSAPKGNSCILQIGVNKNLQMLRNACMSNFHCNCPMGVSKYFAQDSKHIIDDHAVTKCHAFCISTISVPSLFITTPKYTLQHTRTKTEQT